MVYDLIIIGGAAAASTAGVYAARRKLNFAMITKEFGGEVATSGEIGNWPGTILTDGVKLVMQFKEHLKANGVEPLEGVYVNSIEKLDDGNFKINIKDGESMTTKAVIIATGAHPKLLNIPGEKDFRLKGVSYCTTCDGPLFSGQATATIGGGNAALESALMLADLCPKVYVINKNPVFKGEMVLLEKLKARKNVEIIYEVMTTEIFGGVGGFVEGLKYKNKEGVEQSIAVKGIFVHIGQMPNSEMAPAQTAKDKFGHIIVDNGCATNVPGLFAAGDVTDVPFHQIVIAAAQGSIATLTAVNYLNRL